MLRNHALPYRHRQLLNRSHAGMCDAFVPSVRRYTRSSCQIVLDYGKMPRERGSIEETTPLLSKLLFWNFNLSAVSISSQWHNSIHRSFLMFCVCSTTVICCSLNHKCLQPRTVYQSLLLLCFDLVSRRIVGLVAQLEVVGNCTMKEMSWQFLFAI